MTLMYESLDYNKKNHLFQKVKFKIVAAIKFIFRFRFGGDTELIIGVRHVKCCIHIHHSHIFKFFVFPEICIFFIIQKLVFAQIDYATGYDDNVRVTETKQIVYLSSEVITNVMIMKKMMMMTM